MFWLLRKVLKLALLVVVVLAAFVAWALYWPAPHRPRPLHCPPSLNDCVTASGRVLYHTTFGHGRRAHIVILSRDSLTLPGVVSAEFPGYLDHEPAGLGFGDWVRIYGVRETGSHHETDIHVAYVATGSGSIHCGVYDSVHMCRRAADWPGVHH